VTLREFDEIFEAVRNWGRWGDDDELGTLNYITTTSQRTRRGPRPRWSVPIVGHDLEVFRFDEEHGIFSAPGGTSLHVGDPVALVPGYSPSTVNWYDAYHVVRDDDVVDIWPIIPRGPGHHGLAG
jgi:hypothetical protein